VGSEWRRVSLAAGSWAAADTESDCMPRALRDTAGSGVWGGGPVDAVDERTNGMTEWRADVMSGEFLSRCRVGL